MLTDSQLNDLTLNGAITADEITVLFEALDKVGVSALWVDKDFQKYKFNTSNKLIENAVNEAGERSASYTKLLDVIYELHKNPNSNEDPLLSASNWIAKLRVQQLTPMSPQEDHVALSLTGERFISRRVFLNDGSMLAVSFDYVGLQQRDELVKIAFKLSKSGVLCYNIKSNDFLLESPYLERILTPGEYTNVNKYGLFAIIHPEEIEAAKDIFKRSIRAALPVTKNIRIKTEKNGNLWFKFTGQVQRNSKGKKYQHVLTFEDVTEELKVQENLRQNIQDSDQELKERLDFMAKLSHELKTPMNAIVGMSDALLHKSDISEDIRSKLEVIQLSSEHLVNMLDDTLSHAKLQSDNTTLDLQFNDPVKVVSNICKLWEHQALKNGTRIKLQTAPSIPRSIKIDAGRLGQCLNNLISNAAKFTEYGQIDVIVKPHESPNRPPQLAIAVRDNGIGMTDEQKSKIFEAYMQADETISARFGGTGLGMSITKDLVELMGGKINVSSKLNEGTIFLILLPMDVDDSLTAPISPPQNSENTELDSPSHTPHKAVENTSQTTAEKNHETGLPATAKHRETEPVSLDTKNANPTQRIISNAGINSKDLEKLNVLVVDDNETNHIVMSSLLDSVVDKIYSAFDGQQALDVLAVENIDIVLMDIHMPVMDGIEATIAIRQNPDLYQEVRIIALTADPQYQQKRLCVNIGMDEAMSKPVKLVDLIETIKKTMSQPINRLAKAS